MEIFDKTEFVLPFFMAIIFFIVGALTHFFPAKKINSLYGYRTSNSMKSQERWDFAQKYCAKEMIRVGVIFVAMSIVGYFSTIPTAIATTITIGLLFVLIGLLVVRVEMGIKQHFSNK